ncbi:hypothetical protein SAMN05421788_1011464 [Filimonas lacunae]|uniref:Outer membrane protein beta-barrel family protein n=1 Tax=Filimonas lacunae TaxID=477680 RepID=A0A173MQV5_9BACT|nr:hypothetical protein [Filimonas lacunae]BAV10034.1 hypothetical protein FLA_6088 [Filimonas lacunae]SIS82925.1 hypothetical protein SAMN05421788_1011464 [Filimonas lacunae]
MRQLMYKSGLLPVFVCLSFSFLHAQDIDQLAKQKPVSISGTVGIGIGTYKVSGIPSRARKFSYLVSGSPVVSLYGISFPVGIVVSDQQRGFTQPFNQYGASPRYKWLTVHAGWRSLTFSPYTLGGAVFLGGGVEVNPGKLRLGFIYGRFNKAIEADSSKSSNVFTQIPAYKRTGYAAKIGYGTEENHIDFIYLKAKDDSNSVRKLPSSYNITPAENAVFGVSFRYKILKHILLEGDGAGSLYTRDLGADTFSNELLKDAKLLTRIAKINASTQALTAAQAAIGYEAKAFTVKLQYKRIDPNYQSMGAYYFETDVENYTVAPSFFLLQRKLVVSGSLGWQHDNILKDKSFRSNKTIGNVNVGYNVQSFGANVQYSNYGINQSRGLNPVIDTLRVARTNHNLNGMARFSFNSDQLTQNIILVANYQAMVDLNSFTAANSETNSKTGNLSYQVGFVKPGVNVSAVYNYTVADAPSVHTVIHGPSLGLDKQLWQSKLLLNTNWSYQLQSTNSVKAGHYISGSFTGSVRVSKRNSVNATLTYLRSASEDETLNPSFSEFRTNFTYAYTF